LNQEKGGLTEREKGEQLSTEKNIGWKVSTIVVTQLGKSKGDRTPTRGHQKVRARQVEGGRMEVK